MATIDLTRSSTYFTKHYMDVRAQQGRILSDDDHNENERLSEEDRRRSRVDIIGPAGTPDDGFLLANPTVSAKNGCIDFDITPGTFYLGGRRLELEKLETYQEQFDWVNLPASAQIKPPAAGKRLDFAMLETWVQAASAVEDSELFEKAFGGPDTSARMRIMQRVLVSTNVKSADCGANWKQLVADYAAQGISVSPENELVPGATLTVGFAPGSDPGDLCSPPVAGGYLGAFNQAIRVQFVNSTNITWGFDNAAPLYRVMVSTNGAGERKIITMQTPPKDQPHWPLAGQVVELLPWSAVLVNGEKLSELTGFLTKVDASYDPDSGQFSIVDAVLPGFGEEWKTRSDAGQLGKDDFFFLRVWNRGSDTVSPPLIPFVVNKPVTLGQNGLTVTIKGTGFTKGDYWIIAARPDSPDRVVPWSLESGRGPHGYRRFVAALGVIEWDATGAKPVGKVVHDCRDSFPPLTRLRSCCTHTVGDGVTSFGKFNSIQEAIDKLPAEGGEICILPGTYKEHVVIQDRHDIIIHGCDTFTILLDDEKAGKPLITIADSQRITIQELTITATINTAILMTSDPAKEANFAGLGNIHIYDIDFSVRDSGAIEIDGGRFMRIRTNRIQVQPLIAPLNNASDAGKHQAIFSRADDVSIEENVILCHFPRRLFSALGGIQIGGGSERVEIRGNHIEGGNGNGITLGSFRLLTADQKAKLDKGDYTGAFLGALAGGSGYVIFVDNSGCIQVIPDPANPKDPGGKPLVPVSDGDLVDIRIVENDILNMGSNGISTIRLQTANFGVISVIDCQIEQNRIRGCAQLEPSGQQSGSTIFAALGGVVFSYVEYLTLRNNWIEDNGKSFVFPVCGVFVQRGAGLLIEGNQIARNGPLVETASQAAAGARGGIYLTMIRTPFTSRTALKGVATREAGFPAVRIANNVVVSPMGPALILLAQGTAMVEANQLASHATDPFLVAGSNGFTGSTVTIVNLGKAIEFVQQKANFNSLGKFQRTDGAGAYATSTLTTAGGGVLFNDNQVLYAAERPQSPPLASILIVSVDDVSMEGNQSQCLSNGLAVLTNAFVLSLTARAADNRFSEQALNAFLSATTIALMNSTTDNQGTHCFLIVGLPVLTVRTPNTSYADWLAPGLCGDFSKSLASAFQQAGLSAV